MIRVAIIDDHPLYRHGLAMAVEQAEDFTLVADAASIEDFGRLDVTADVALLDLHLPGIEGAEGRAHLRARTEGHRRIRRRRRRRCDRRPRRRRSRIPDQGCRGP